MYMEWILKWRFIKPRLLVLFIFKELITVCSWGNFQMLLIFLGKLLTGEEKKFCYNRAAASVYCILFCLFIQGLLLPRLALNSGLLRVTCFHLLRALPWARHPAGLTTLLWSMEAAGCNLSIQEAEAGAHLQFEIKVSMGYTLRPCLKIKPPKPATMLPHSCRGPQTSEVPTLNTVVMAIRF